MEKGPMEAVIFSGVLVLGHCLTQAVNCKPVVWPLNNRWRQAARLVASLIVILLLQIYKFNPGG